uniref:Globin family profile domain-containing protein n=1 Tax=Romanomermis culicivorax TaxID=13658 RepID=A0A915IU85_ROMCU
MSSFSHARVFQNVIEMVVDSTDALDDVMGPLLFSYGSRHAHFPSSSGFKPDYWDLFAAAMTDYARHSWRTRDKKTIEAWRLTVGFIISKMKEGFYFECKKMEKESAQHH